MSNNTTAVPGTGIGIGDLHACVPVKGYRPLTDAEVAAMNMVKALGLKLDEFITAATIGDLGVKVDPRWMAIAKTELQKGMMFLGRSIAQPDGF